MLLSIAGAPPCRTEIDRLSFDPQVGGVYVLRLDDGAIEERRSDTRQA